MELHLQLLNMFGVGIIAIVGLLKFTKNKEGSLNWKGWILFIFGFLMLSISNLLLNLKNQDLNDELVHTSKELANINLKLHHSNNELGKTTLELNEIFNKLYSQDFIIRKTSPQVTLNKTQENLSITNPLDGTNVNWRPTIEGKITNINKNIFLIVRPLSNNSYWVQPSVSISRDGEWKGTVYIGRANKDIGEEFEVMAIANPEVELKIGDVFDNWPKSEWNSQIIKLIRK
ncbi:hypothetical protein ACFLS4_05500 [Bacteroidota bacterium]